MTHHLAFDLGAESGRALLGRLNRGVLSLSEVRRFANTPITIGASLRWDVDRLWAEMQQALRDASGTALSSIGVDTWGCDYALLDERGGLLEPPFHYRDHRTDDVMAAAFNRVPRERIYNTTGIQFLPFNTLFQLVAARQAQAAVLERAASFVTIPDLLNYWLTGRIACEYTNATTTQCIDARTRTWATSAARRPGHPHAPVRAHRRGRHGDRPCAAGRGRGCGRRRGRTRVPRHGLCRRVRARIGRDGVSQFRHMVAPRRGDVRRPSSAIEGRDLNFTNEGGVFGTTRLLKNIGGLWLLQACRRDWAAQGASLSYEALVAAAEGQRDTCRSLIDPDDPSFLNPPDMPRAIADYCRRTDQPAPDKPAAFARTIFESLALKYRVVLEWLEELTGTPITTIRVIGGGARNRLLNQLDRRRDRPHGRRRARGSDGPRQHRDAARRHRLRRLARRRPRDHRPLVSR